MKTLPLLLLSALLLSSCADAERAVRAATGARGKGPPPAAGTSDAQGRPPRPGEGKDAKAEGRPARPDGNGTQAPPPGSATTTTGASPSTPVASAATGSVAEVGRTFIAEAGIRVNDAGVPEAGWDAATGATYLYYHGTNGRPTYSVAADGLNFGKATFVTDSYPFDPRRTRISSGKWRRYYMDDRYGGVVSETSTDGLKFTLDVGKDKKPVIRYRPTADDNGTMVYTETLLDTAGNVILFYIGDRKGKNNIRRAISKDGGESFVFDRSGMFGDADSGGGARSFVDPAPVRLADGRLRVYVMRGAKEIHSFVSTDDGQTFTYEGEAIDYQAWKGMNLSGIFDPTVVPLLSGGYRMYVAAESEDGKGGKTRTILSAVSK